VSRSEAPSAGFGRDAVWTFVGLAGASGCLTILWLSMRAVMDIGGTCASGGPFEIARPCPKGVAGLVPLSILGGLVFFGLYLFKNRLGGPNLAILAWPALFLSLGWNFLQFGLDPPGDQGVVGGWIFCGIVFVLMGAGPLVPVLSGRGIRRTLWGPGDATTSPGPIATVAAEALRTTVRSAVRPRSSSWGAPPRPPAPPHGGDLVSELERLAALHVAGALDDAEFAASKQRLIHGNRQT
jgi:hypothetical protein